MPELPDIAAYISALELRIVAQPIERVRLASPFLLRTAQPPITNVEGRVVRELRRVGKRIAIGLEGDLWLVLLWTALIVVLGMILFPQEIAAFIADRFSGR